MRKFLEGSAVGIERRTQLPQREDSGFFMNKKRMNQKRQCKRLETLLLEAGQAEFSLSG
jgi:hypothetical protein